MSKSRATWNKKEREKKKQKQRLEKEEKRKERKENSRDGNKLDEMMGYIDEFGNISTTPPDPAKKVEVKLEDIVIGVPSRPEEDENSVREGTLAFFNESRGFGFIVDRETGERVFVHANNMLDPLRENNQVSFEVEMGKKGPAATNVKLIK